jgi:diadenosine tetraphosphate (Ap4A) HIT family hydrolase
MNFRLPVMEPCPFCELARQDSPWNLIERTPTTLTLLNGRQFEIGQCIVMPRRHAPTLLELTDEECGDVMRAAKRIGALLGATYRPEAMLLYQNNGIAVGQEVPHFHLHVVPRRAASNWTTGPRPLETANRANLGAHADHAVVTAEKLATVAELLAAVELGRGR